MKYCPCCGRPYEMTRKEVLEEARKDGEKAAVDLLKKLLQRGIVE